MPCGPVNNIQQAFDDPQIQHRGMQFDIGVAKSEKIPQIANPVKFSLSATEYKIPPSKAGYWWAARYAHKGWDRSLRWMKPRSKSKYSDCCIDIYS